MPRGVIILPNANSHGKHDQTGAFLPESQRFQRVWGIPDDHVIFVDLSKDQGTRAAEVLSTLVKLGKGEPILNILFAGHGLRGSLPQLRGVTAPKLAGALASVKHPSPRVYLAACSTGSGTAEDPITGIGGDGGFADGVRDAFAMNGATDVWVTAHITAGHAFWNPEVRRFEGKGLQGAAAGGSMLVAHADRLWPKWRTRLRDDPDLRFMIHTLTAEQVRERLAA